MAGKWPSPSEDSGLAGTLIPDVRPAELWDNGFLSLKRRPAV